MRKVIDLQTKIWQTGIENIELDHKSRDEIPKLLIGLQFLYSNIEIRDKVFKILKRLIPNNTNTKTGRPGMDLWKILVLGTLRLNCNWDYDKAHEIANNHRIVRLMLQHDENDWRRYGLQTIKDNVWLLSPEILDEINQVVVAEGHKLILTDGEEQLKGNCDSFVVETNVHYPTDTNLLFDAVRKMIQLVAVLCSEIGLTDWRQHHKNILKMKELLRLVERVWHSKPKKEAMKAERQERIIQTTTEYLDVARKYVSKAKLTLSIMREMGIISVIQDVKLLQIEEYIRHAERQIDQVERRAIHDEKIPHEEKVFSIFEPHTEWIQKGKAGVSQELGLRVSIVKDQYGFILHHMVMEKQTDDKVAVPIVQETKERYPAFVSCSFDKGYYSPENKNKLKEIIDKVILPKKGRLSVQEKEVEYSEEFIRARRKHAGVESAINALENHGLDRCLDHGIDGFKRYVALAVVARNIQIIGHAIQQKQLKSMNRAEKLQRAA